MPGTMHAASPTAKSGAADDPSPCSSDRVRGRGTGSCGRRPACRERGDRRSVTSSSYLILSGDVPLAARVYRAVDDPFVRQPAVLVSGSWLTVKEQMVHTYATALAAQGYTAFTFDFAGFGQSGGTPRQAEIPARKITDITEAARYVSTLSYIRPGGVGYLAIYATAQYALAAVAEGAPIASFASVAGWYHDSASLTPVYGGVDGMTTRMDRAREALDAYLRTGEVRTTPAYKEGNDRAAMSFKLDYYTSPARGAASRVSVPTLFVHSDDCALPDNVRACVAGSPDRASWSGPMEPRSTSTTNPRRFPSRSTPRTNTS
jgi:uncharacterized protein